MNTFLLNPSFYAHTFNSLFLLAGLILFFTNYIKIRHLDAYKLTTLYLLFSLAIGIHGLSHLGLEYVYGFNPLRNLSLF
jgi:uncharacterized membrane protein